MTPFRVLLSDLGKYKHKPILKNFAVAQGRSSTALVCVQKVWLRCPCVSIPGPANFGFPPGPDCQWLALVWFVHFAVV